MSLHPTPFEPDTAQPPSRVDQAATGRGAPLRNMWYVALPSDRLKTGTMAHRQVLGDPILVARGRDGVAFAMRDICPHRGVPLTYGRFDGATVECPYHGWRFDGVGRCAAIPSLVDDQAFDIGRIRVPTYPCHEDHGLVWVFIGDATENDPVNRLAPPEVPNLGNACRISETMTFPCGIDHAVVGLMDPAHGPFVHRAWWWRSGRSIHPKIKRFVPSPLGFTMVRHPPSSNSFGYKLLGGAVTTEIAFQLPGIRIEHVTAGRHSLSTVTTATPVSDAETEVQVTVSWTQPWLTPARPLVRAFARAFLGQDRRMVAMQQDGLRHNPTLMLINDSDTQAKWYYRLKREWQQCQRDQRPFRNPLRERELRWRS